MEPIIFFLIIIVVGGSALYQYYFNTENILKRQLKNTPGKKIHEFSSTEEGKIVGKVALHQEILNAPLSDRQCVYYKVIVEQKKSRGKSSHWVEIFTDEKAVDFLVDQNGERALVKKDFLHGVLERDASYSSGFLNDPSPKLLKYLRQYGVESTNVLGFNKTFRYKEGILELGEEIAIMGQASWEDPDPNTGGYKRLVFTGNGASPVYVSDYKTTLT